MHSLLVSATFRSPRTARAVRIPMAVVVALGVALLTGCGTVAVGDPGGDGPPVAPVDPVPSPPSSDEPSVDPEQDDFSCPASGLRATADFTNPAMGLRVMGLRLVNCGDTPRRIEGYPVVTLLDEDAEALDVEVVNGSGDIAVVEGFDDPPVPFDLEPGEQASAELMWRNTVTHVDDFRYPAPYLTVAPMPGEEAQLVIPDGDIDTGSTGIAGVSAWKPFPPAL
ncbi:DUF4232 domain-containing protein [Streptomyces sp. ST2-7A]|uniref:DUF4232 domain-containing protein n=1 Tax=Streptomyces sp. ST2-7A TaxID=2907214 RepID=UPI001F237070|nr:DUF4232 domain-containing protein [Streptomyces sp. ST2-7A]MCE7080726.1 DUF4232 domain-containing protein [Streptomyces sp. ST2-7A]